MNWHFTRHIVFQSTRCLWKRLHTKFSLRIYISGTVYLLAHVWSLRHCRLNPVVAIFKEHFLKRSTLKHTIWFTSLYHIQCVFLQACNWIEIPGSHTCFCADVPFDSCGCNIQLVYSRLPVDIPFDSHTCFPVDCALGVKHWATYTCHCTNNWIYTAGPYICFAYLHKEMFTFLLFKVWLIFTFTLLWLSIFLPSSILHKNLKIQPCFFYPKEGHNVTHLWQQSAVENAWT